MENVISTIYHLGVNMWIVNQLPLFVPQTICTIPRSGSDPTQSGVTGLQHNWVDNLIFVSTKTLDVEYGVGSLMLDCWAFRLTTCVDQPHHQVGGAKVVALQWAAGFHPGGLENRDHH